MNEHKRMEADYWNSVSATLLKERELDSKAAQLAAERESLNTIDFLCFWGKVLGTVLLCVGGVKWYRWQKKQDAETPGIALTSPGKTAKVGVALALAGVAVVGLACGARAFTAIVAEGTRAERNSLGIRVGGEVKATVPGKEPDSWLLARLGRGEEGDDAERRKKSKAVIDKLVTQYPGLRKHREVVDRSNKLDERLEWQGRWERWFDELLIPACWLGGVLTVVGLLLAATDRWRIGAPTVPKPDPEPAAALAPTPAAPSPSETVIG